jgi:hypothetical protein
MNHRLRPGKQGIVFLPPDTKPVLQSYKEPLRPTANGYGYLGTLVYDPTIWSEEAIIEALQNFKVMHGREPYYSDLRTKQLPAAATVVARFGSWSKAKEEAFSLKPYCQANK